MIQNRDTAKLVSETIHRFRDEMRELHASVKASCTPEHFASYNRAVSRILHHLDADILQRLYAAHPDIRPKDWPILRRGADTVTMTALFVIAMIVVALWIASVAMKKFYEARFVPRANPQGH